MAQSKESQEKQKKLGASLSTLFNGLNRTSSSDLSSVVSTSFHKDKNIGSRTLMDPHNEKDHLIARKCCLKNPAILVQKCLINNPEDCFQVNICEQCPDNKNNG